jgi:hypothetical protein
MSQQIAQEHVWLIRPATVAEIAKLVDDHSFELAALIDTAPCYPMEDEAAYNSLFNMLSEWPGLSYDILALTRPPENVLAHTRPRTAASIAIAMIKETRQALGHDVFRAAVVESLRETSGFLSPVRH